MKKASLKLLILFLLITTIVIVGLSSVAYAFWGSDPSRNINGDNATNINISDDITYKYMVFEANLDDGDCHFRYSDTTKNFILYELYDDDISISNVNDILEVSVIGYMGTLGEYESLIIPDSIEIKVGDNEKQVNVTAINMHSVEEFSALMLIKDVVVSKNVIEIRGASFSGCGNLENVYFNSTIVPSINTYCFINSQTISFYKKSGNSYVSATITRGAV